MEVRLESKLVLAMLEAAAEAAYDAGEEPGDVRVFGFDDDAGVIRIVTYNAGVPGGQRRTWARVTDDGFAVVWFDGDYNVPTGADWLPDELADWLQGR